MATVTKAAVLLIGVAGMAGLGRADISYTTEMRAGPALANPEAPPMMVITRASRPGALREQSVTQFGPVKMTTLKLTLCEKHQQYQLNSALKIYTVAPLREVTAGGAPGAGGADKSAEDEGPDTGKMIMTYAAKDLGEETIADRKTHHYTITTRVQSSGCAGTGDRTMKMEMWTASDLRLPVACGDQMPQMPTGRPGMRPTKCKISFEYRGDTDQMRASAGIPLKMRVYEGNTDKLMMEQVVTEIKQDTLADDLFTIPADYKQVTEAEFQQKQQQALMQQMMRGH